MVQWGHEYKGWHVGANNIEQLCFKVIQFNLFKIKVRFFLTSIIRGHLNQTFNMNLFGLFVSF